MLDDFHYYVVHVVSPGDPESGVHRYERRFEFLSAIDAETCERHAREAGLEARTERVLSVRRAMRPAGAGVGNS